MPNAKSVKECYFAWLAPQVSSAQLSELYTVYADIEEFCLNQKIISIKLFELTNYADVRKVISTVESNRIFRFTHKRSLSKMTAAMRFYHRFLKENPEFLKKNNLVVKKEEQVSVTKNEDKTISAIDLSKREQEGLTKSPPDEVVDFTVEESFSYTQPTGFSYFKKHQVKVTLWTQLYVQVVACLLEDYPNILKSYLNNDINGKRRCDFSNEAGMDAMTAPKKVRDGFYLETNISAMDIVKKIKRLLDLCNVDYENLIIHYQKKKYIVDNCTPFQEAENGTGNIDISNERQRFIEWMRRDGVAVGTILSYLSAIGQSSNIVKEHNICDTDLLLIRDAKRLEEIEGLLLNISNLKENNARQHNRFRAALTKLVAFRSAIYASQSSSQAAITICEAQADVPNKISDPISEKVCLSYAEILIEFFAEDGYQLGRAIFRGRFKRYYAEKFGYDPQEPDERIDDILIKVGTKRGDRVFPKQGEHQNDLISNIIADIMATFEDGATAVFVESVFDKYQRELADDLQIYNQDALSDLLMAEANGRYMQRYAYLSTNASEADPAKDLLRIMKSFHQPQSYTSIYKKAWFIPYMKMKSLLASERSVVNVASETYFYAPNLPVSAEELVQLANLIREELNDHSHITDVKMMKLIQEKCPTIAINTDGYTIYGLRNCLGYLLRNQFAFNGPIISLKGKELSMSDVYAEFSRDHEMLQLDDLTNLSTEMNTSIYWDAVLSEMIRVSETEFVRKDQICFDIETIDAVLEEMCQGDYVPVRDLTLFLHFPNVGYQWNSYLLESYLFSCSRKFHLFHSSFMKTGVYGAMVRVDSDIHDYRSLLLDVLSKSDALSSPNAALQYIVDQGYQQRRRYEGIEVLIQEAKLKKEQQENYEK